VAEAQLQCNLRITKGQGFSATTMSRRATIFSYVMGIEKAETVEAFEIFGLLTCRPICGNCHQSLQMLTHQLKLLNRNSFRLVYFCIVIALYACTFVADAFCWKARRNA